MTVTQDDFRQRGVKDNGLEYTLLQAGEADLLAAGLRRVYGDSYPITEFYDASYVAGLIAADKLFTVVARNEAGEVVGQMSTVLEQVGDVTADGSALMVDRHYRGLGATAHLGRVMTEVYQSHAICGLHLYALALHDRVQQASGRAGAVVTGVLPAWFTHRARVDGYNYPAGCRIGAVCLYMPLAPLPARRVFLPMPYVDVLEDIYRRLPAERALSPSVGDSARVKHSRIRRDDKPGNGHRRLVVEATGQDLGQHLARLCDDEDGAEEVQFLDLSLADPAVGWAVAMARGLGFFFGALMVDRCGADHLRLQRYRSALAAPEAMVLATSEAIDMLEYILADYSDT